MRRILVLLVIVAAGAAALAALWIFRGREISSFIDRFWAVETRSGPIQSIAYEGNGTGGILIVNDLSLSLNEVGPGLALSVGSTKDNQLALASSGKVFPFGPLTSTSENTGERLATVPPLGDQAFVAIRHSVLSWPTPFDLNSMTGHVRLGNGTFTTKFGGRNPPERTWKCFGVTSNFFILATAGTADS
jgi:hypothetical protein